VGQLDAVIVVGGSVVVIVGIAEDVGRMGRMAVAEDVVVGFGVVVEAVGEEVWDEEEAVAVAIVDVTSVKVEKDVTASVFEVDWDAGGTTGAGAWVVEEGLGVLLGGDAVTTGWMVVIAVELATQPTLAHAYPATQHPPPALSGQLIFPSGQPATSPPQFCPSPQHPTSPCPESVIDWQVEPFGQQLFGRFMEVQAVVPPGHENARWSREKISRGDFRRRPASGRALPCWLPWRANGACSG